MPSPKRWHPVNRDLNDDPDVWEFTEHFGDRALRTLLEVLAQLDRADNRVKVSSAWLSGMSRKVRQTRSRLHEQVEWMVEKDWLRVVPEPAHELLAVDPPVSGQSAADQRRVIREALTDGPPVILMAVNFAKYHKKRESGGAKQGSDQDPLLSEPSLSEPKKEKEIAGSASPAPACGSNGHKKQKTYPADDAEFIARLKDNPAYRDIDIDREIGKARAYLLTPKAKGRKLTRQYLLNWLNRIDRPVTVSAHRPKKVEL